MTRSTLEVWINDMADSVSVYQGRSFDTADSGSGHQGGSYSVKANNCRGMRLHNYKGPYDRNKLRIARDDLMGRVQRCKNSAIWNGINTETDIYGYQYCDSRDDGYGDPSSIFSHAGDPSEIHWDDEDFTLTDDRPSISTGFPTSTVSSINDSMVTKKTNVETVTMDMKVSECNTSSVAKSCKSVEKKSSLVIDGRSPLKDFSVKVVIQIDNEEGTGSTGRSVVIGDSEECIVAKQQGSIESAGGTQADKKDSSDLNVVVEAEESEDEHDALQEMSMNGLKKMFQCDYCLFVTANESEMLVHLREGLHCSASSVLATSEKVVSYLNKPAALKYDHLYPSKMAVCPAMRCQQLFKDAIECESHSAICHKKHNTSGYCVVDVINLEYVKVPFLPNTNTMVCNKCGFQANTVKSLKKHYMKKKHYPYKTRPNCDYYTACPVCPKKIFSEFCQAVHHVNKQQTVSHAREINDGKITLMVYTVSQDRKLIKLPPFIPIGIRIRGLNRSKRDFLVNKARQKLMTPSETSTAC